MNNPQSHPHGKHVAIFERSTPQKPSDTTVIESILNAPKMLLYTHNPLLKCFVDCVYICSINQGF